MNITRLPAAQAHELWPLLCVVHDLHVDHQPQRYVANPDRDQCVTWLSETLKGPDHIAFVARDLEGTAIGYILCHKRSGADAPMIPARNHGLIEHISVLPSHHRQGIGHALIEVLREHLKDEGYTTMGAIYGTFNAASAELMKSAGLLPVSNYAEGAV
ncbi:GNAT family N-acetyltransferase [Halocynthiibacter namhaensis]|uniref:GNAT family N-acetyltransferase n=1 Tax=Halocynthiibacter namhaensis TaxID=1290553 RepID=UPI000692091A|nr:GNAT family N-acetyltransferase [Halocynthiibacter namhaensis]